MRYEVSIAISTVYAALSILLMASVLPIVTMLSIPPAYAVMLRAAVAWLMLMLFFPKKEMFRLKKKPHYFPLILAGIGMAFTWWSLFEAVTWAPVGTVVTVFFMYPIVENLLKITTFDWENLEVFDLLELIIYTLCLVWIIPEWSWDNNVTIGIGLAAVAAVIIVMQSKLTQETANHYDQEIVLRYQWSVATVIMLPFCWGMDFDMAVSDVGWVLVLGVLCTYFAEAIFAASVASVPTYALFMLYRLQPLFAIFIAWLLLGEQLPASGIWAAGIVCLMAVGRVMLDTTKLPPDTREMTEHDFYSDRMDKHRKRWMDQDLANEE